MGEGEELRLGGRSEGREGRLGAEARGDERGRLQEGSGSFRSSASGFPGQFRMQRRRVASCLAPASVGCSLLGDCGKVEAPEIK